jgi:thiol-disulfide isomerase/thioredoxin
VSGVIVVVVVLVLSVAFGLYRRRVDGRMRTTAVPRPVADDAPEVGLESAGSPVHHARMSAHDLGAPLGERATLVQFSTAFCAPCRATRRTLDEVAAMLDGVAHVEIDAEAHLDLVRRMKVVRTPTVLVLDERGHVVRRATGAPRKPDVIAALAPLV